AGVIPDIVTLSKALTGGTLPLAVTIARQRIFDAFWSDDPGDALLHGPTFMANALACAAANASLDLFEREPRLRQIADIASALEHGLAPCRGRPGVKDVRVRGAIGVVELEQIDDLEALRARFVEEGVFVRPFGSVIYLTPAFTISAQELAKLTEAVTKIVSARWALKIQRREGPCDKGLKIRRPCRADRIRLRARSAPLQSRLSAADGGLSR